MAERRRGISRDPRDSRPAMDAAIGSVQKSIDLAPLSRLPRGVVAQLGEALDILRIARKGSDA